MDSTTDQSLYKTHLAASAALCDLSSIFLTSLVPLQLITAAGDVQHQVEIWRNPTPSSTRYCRPIEFNFQKETEDTVLRQQKKIVDQIAALVPTSFTSKNGTTFKISYQLEETMIDGKILSPHTRSSQCCPI